MIFFAALLLTSPAPQESWGALELPRICEERHFGGVPAQIESGQHVSLDNAAEAVARNSQILFPPQDLGNLLQVTAQTAQKNLKVSPYSPPLYVQGSAEDLAWAQTAVGALSVAADRQYLEVSAWLVPGADAADAPPTQITAQGAAGARAWRREVLSGEEILLGQRLEESFLASFDVDVSTQAGVAAPTIGQVTTGKTLHLRVSRVDGGRRYHLRGHLDLAELTGFSSFDPGTPDLGMFMQPNVQSISLTFSAVGKMGDAQRIVIRGAPLDQPDWVLWVRVDGQAEPQGARAADTELGHDWRALDLTLLEGRARTFPALSPGARLSRTHSLESISPQTATISASGVLGLLQTSGRSRRSGAGSRTADPLQICKGLILVAASESANGLADRIAQFVRSAESERLNSSRVHLRHGGLQVEFPTAMGEVARLWVGTERLLVTGYSSQIAPSTWMPIPNVEHLRDGLAWQGQLGNQRLSSQAWVAHTDAVQILNQKQAQLGAVQLPKRRVRGARLALPLAGPMITMLAADGSDPELALRVSQAAGIGK